MKIEELSQLLRDADPSVVLVPQPVLDRLIQNVNGSAWAVWRVRHNHCTMVGRHVLFNYVEQEEVYLPPDHLLPETVLVLGRPTGEELAGPKPELLGRYWRRLFHITLHRELTAALATVGPAGLRDRVARIGAAAFDEARNVLAQDSLLSPGADDRTTYIEFAATFLELRFFAPNLIPICFPSLPPVADVDALVAADVDGAAWYERTRLAGAPDPAPKTDDQADESHDFYYRLARSAYRRRQAGDTVGAAILHTRAARVAPAALTAVAQDAAKRDVFALADRLRAVLDLTDDEAAGWRKVLPALLDKADQGNRPVEASLLYDLQRACQDFEITPVALDLVEWALSAGQRPVRRPLDGQRFVKLPAHLRSATVRLTAARLTDADRQALGGLLRSALDKSEEMLRRRFRPVLTEALRDAGLRPQSGPEQAALAKTVEELLDRISAAGFFGYADLRDAIARGQIKLPDLAGPHEYLRGDPLLRLDRRLGTLLDGVYRRGEFYSRMLERGTAFMFGTEPGRWATLNVVLPFGGALLAGQFLWLIEYERREKFLGVAREVLAAVASQAGVEAAKPAGLRVPEVSFFGGWNADPVFHVLWLALGVVFLGMVRSARVRAAAKATGRAIYRAARFVFWDVPVRVAAHPTVRMLFGSGPVQLALNYGAKPLALSGVVWAVFPDVWAAGSAVRLFTLVAAGVVVNSRVGAAFEAVLFEVASGLLRVVRALPAVVHWISDLFREFVGIVEWVLARGEDWLRLRGGDGPVSVAVRAAAGLVWFPFAFLARFYMVVLVEPMLNPLKLPLSILFAKFVYPLLAILGLFQVSTLSSPLVDDLGPYLGWPVAWLLVVGTCYLAPDAVTFLFWEMRENWKLYRANRPAAVKPVAVGPHGETVVGLLRPGFHSGTVPKLFAALRDAERAGAETGEWRAARANRQALRGVEEAVGRFVARDLAAVLNPSPAWGGRKLSAGPVHLGTNRIRAELRLDGEAAPAVIEWEDRSGWLVAGWGAPAWTADLPPVPARALANALAYLYKRSGVDLVREHLRAELPKEATHFDVTAGGLLVWYGPRDEAPVLYDLAAPADELRPRAADNLHPAVGPALDADRLVFSRVTLTWPEWLAVWKPDPGAAPPPFGPAGFELTVLPPRPPSPPPPPAAAAG